MMKIIGRLLFGSALLLAGCISAEKRIAPLISAQDLAFLEDITVAVIEASRVQAGAKVGRFGPNTSGGTLIRPGGRSCYPAFWIRDYAMSLGCGLIPREEQLHMLLFAASHQQDLDWSLASGSVVPAGSIPDHISFDGKPIFFPGVLDDFEGQGCEKWGKLPSLDDQYFFVHMAWAYVNGTGDARVLNREVRGKTLIHRLQEAYATPPVRDDTGLVYVDKDNRGVSFGFVDGTTHTGELLFCSVLKYRAAHELADLYGRLGNTVRVSIYREQAARIKEAICRTFVLESGLLRASTGLSGQPDVWGTAFAVYVGALTPKAERAACTALARAVRKGIIAWRGNIRHVPTDSDFSEDTTWEVSVARKNRYQNGAYWGTPAGWVCYAIAKEDVRLAADLARQYVEELREGDFRKGPQFGSPWECMHPENDHRQNPVYMTSVTCPLAVFKKLTFELR
jgi:hypothetical protein